MPLRCGVISSENSDGMLMVRWASINLFDLNYYGDELISNKFTYKNKSWRLKLSWFTSSSSGNSFKEDSDLRLRIVDANNRENIAFFRDLNGELMFEARLEIGNAIFYPEDVEPSVVFCNTSFKSYKEAQIFVEFFKHEKGFKTDHSHLTGDRYIELSKNLKESYLNKLHCDFSITVKQQSFQVHKVILTTRSTVFAAMMKNDMAEKETNSVDITDCDPGAFHVFLLYLYSGEIGELSTENVIDVYVIADKYGVGNLKRDCVEYMKKNISFDRFCDITKLAAKYTELDLLKMSKNFFVENSRKIVSTLNFQLLMKENTVLASELILLLTPEN